MQLKYKDIIEKQKLKIKCPFETCEPKDIIGYRWIQDPLKSKGNFVPSIVLQETENKPARKNSNDDYSKCSDCGLSMFLTEEKAKKRFKGFTNRTRTLLGYTHIAKGNLDKNDGLSSETNSIGHFDFFEFERIDLSNKFEIIAELV